MVLVLFCVVLAGLVLILCLLSFHHYLPLLLHAREAPKGSFGWPLLGETLTFLHPHASNSIGSFLKHHCSRYGKVFKSHLFCSPTIVSCDQELNYFILQNEEKLFQCSYPKPIHGILGKSSMLAVVGESHKKLRSLAVMLVNATKSSPEYLIDIEKTAIRVMGSWKNKHHEIIFCEEARKFTFNVIVKQVLGLAPNDPSTSRILKNFLAFMRGLISFPLYIPGSPYAKAVQARGRIFSIVKAIIKERKQLGDKYDQKGDFLDMLLSVHGLSDDEKVSFVLDALLGGYETTSLLMSMVVHFLGQSLPALEQLEWEHRQIRLTKLHKDDFLDWEDYKKMEFTQHVISEALRCGNIVKFVHRKALKDVRYKEYLIPSGWKVLPIFSAVHLDPCLHGTSLEFNPWRWEDQGQATSKNFTPFGGGPRCCPGSELAKVETAFFLHHLVLNFRWSTVGMDHPMAYPYVEFHNGLPVSFIPIKQQ